MPNQKRRTKEVQFLYCPTSNQSGSAHNKAPTSRHHRPHQRLSNEDTTILTKSSRTTALQDSWEATKNAIDAPQRP